jgi:predicted amidohydrolase
MQELALGAASSRDFLPVMSRWAALLSSYLVFSFEELAAADGAAIDTPRLKYNAAAVFDRGGALVATYRKQRITAKERAAGFSEGSGGPVLIDADFARFSVLVCQDLFYPELWQVVRVRARTLFLALVRLRAPFFLEKTESRQRKPSRRCHRIRPR